MRLPLHFLALILMSQQADIRLDVNLQEVRFSVQDGSGSAISTLTSRDFIVEENGIRPDAAIVRHDTDAPVSFGVLIDTSYPMDMRSVLGDWSVMDAAKATARELLAQMKPQDEMAVMTFESDRSLVVAQDFTNQKTQIEEVLQTLRPRQCCNTGVSNLSAPLPLALEKLRTAKYKNRVLVISYWYFGLDIPTFRPDMYKSALQSLQRRVDALELPIYSIPVLGDGVLPNDRSRVPAGAEFDSQRADEFNVNPFTEESGGHTFHFDFNALRSPKVLTRLQEFIQQLNLDLRSQYVLTYYSKAAEVSPRRVRIRPISSDYRIHIFRSPLQIDISQEGMSNIDADMTPPDRAAAGKFRDSDFVRIPAGEFQMGCAKTDAGCFPTDFGQGPGLGIPRANDARLNPWKVRIRKSFELGKYEVTQAQWESVLGRNPSYFRGADRPVESVSWNDVQEFLKKLNARKDGYRYRLPSEEEWEYAARAGMSGLYKESLEATSWLVDNSNRQTHKVGTKQPNAWGLYDMYGNVFEWIQDENLDQPRDGTGLGAGNYVIEGPPTRRIRGGSWFSTSVFSRTSYRMGLTPDRRLSTLGFRIVREK